MKWLLTLFLIILNLSAIANDSGLEMLVIKRLKHDGDTTRIDYTPNDSNQWGEWHTGKEIGRSGSNKKQLKDMRDISAATDGDRYCVVGRRQLAMIPPLLVVPRPSSYSQTIWCSKTGLDASSWVRLGWLNGGNKDAKMTDIATDGSKWCLFFREQGDSDDRTLIRCTSSNSTYDHTDFNFENKGKHGSEMWDTSGAGDSIRWCIAATKRADGHKGEVVCTKPFTSIDQAFDSKVTFNTEFDHKGVSIATDGKRWCAVYTKRSDHKPWISCTTDGKNPSESGSWSSLESFLGTETEDLEIETDGLRWCVATRKRQTGNNANEGETKLWCTTSGSDPLLKTSWSELKNFGEKSEDVGLAMARSCTPAGKTPRSGNEAQCCADLVLLNGQCQAPAPEIDEPSVEPSTTCDQLSDQSFIGQHGNLYMEKKYFTTMSALFQTIDKPIIKNSNYSGDDFNSKVGSFIQNGNVNHSNLKSYIEKLESSTEQLAVFFKTVAKDIEPMNAEMAQKHAKYDAAQSIMQQLQSSKEITEKNTLWGQFLDEMQLSPEADQKARGEDALNLNVGLIVVDKDLREQNKEYYLRLASRLEAYIPLLGDIELKAANEAWRCENTRIRDCGSWRTLNTDDYRYYVNPFYNQKMVKGTSYTGTLGASRVDKNSSPNFLEQLLPNKTGTCSYPASQGVDSAAIPICGTISGDDSNVKLKSYMETADHFKKPENYKNYLLDFSEYKLTANQQSNYLNNLGRDAYYLYRYYTSLFESNATDAPQESGIDSTRWNQLGLTTATTMIRRTFSLLVGYYKSRAASYEKQVDCVDSSLEGIEKSHEYQANNYDPDGEETTTYSVQTSISQTQQSSAGLSSEGFQVNMNGGLGGNISGGAGSLSGTSSSKTGSGNIGQTGGSQSNLHNWNDATKKAQNKRQQLLDRFSKRNKQALNSMVAKSNSANSGFGFSAPGIKKGGKKSGSGGAAGLSMGNMKLSDAVSNNQNPKDKATNKKEGVQIPTKEELDGIASGSSSTSLFSGYSDGYAGGNAEGDSNVSAEENSRNQDLIKQVDNNRSKFKGKDADELFEKVTKAYVRNYNRVLKVREKK